MQFDLAGTVIFPESKFPQGIGGLRAAIAMELDTASGLKTASALAKLPGSKLFGSMEVRDGTVAISKSAGKALEISVGGSLVLPEFFPAGLRGMTVEIRAFTLNTSGEILDVDIGASGVGAKIFGAVELSNGRVNFKKGGENEFLVAIDGSVCFNSAVLPEGLRNAALEIRTLELSTRSGLRAFDAGVKGELAFSVLGGVRITVNSLDFSETGMSMGASAKLPTNYPNGLANAQFVLSALKLGWNGALLDIKGGITKCSITLAGFAATIDELYFANDAAGQFYVAMKACKLQIPKDFGSTGGQSVAIKNAKFNPSDGSFMGDIEVAKIETEIAGFKLVMDKPSLSFSENLINFSKVTLKLPEFLGKGEVALKKVTLSATEGMKVSGGAFKLPNFNVGLFAFNNVKVEFSFSNSKYSLEGSGSVIIPGAGNISASLGFTTKSSTYPIGLKRAEFSYVLDVGGIPLGATGLFVNGISGGISYGPPGEVPSLVQGLFNDTGPRIRVGLSVGDSHGGSIISMKPTAWVDITNGSWAFDGTAAVLKGFLNITTEVIAALGDKGFLGYLDVDIKFARGSVTVYVFDKSGDAIMAGEGKVEFGVPKGQIIDTWLLDIPSGSLWLAKVNAAFGRFTNGKTGIKGTVDLPVLGTTGIFVGSGGIDIGSLSSYRIEKPNWSKSIRFFDNGGVDSYDRRDSSGNVDASYQFFVPPKGESITAPISLIGEEYDENKTIPDSGLDRLVIVLECLEGAPELTVTAPSGIEYSEGYEGCETIVEEHGIVMVVRSAEAGIWQLRVKGLEEEAYRLSAMGSMAMPLLELEEPSLLPDSAVEKTPDEARVRGRTEKGQNSVRIFARESEDLPGFDLGSYAVDAEGRFDMMVPLMDLGDGEYLIYAELDGPDVKFSPLAYAPGKIVLDRSDLPMLAPQMRVAETDSGILSLRWQNNNGGRAGGYKVKIYDQSAKTESIVYVGNITALDLPGHTAGQEMSFSVAALDATGATGPWSAAVSIRPGQEKPRVNHPAAALERVEAKGLIGGFIEGVIRADIENFQERSDAAGYVGIRYAGPPLEQFLTLRFDPPKRVTETGVEIAWSMGVDESTAPGLYEYPCEFFNEANGDLNSPFTLAVEVSRPVPEVAWVDPDEISGIDETALLVHGSGFIPGTRVFWRDEELAILDSNSGSMRVSAPARFSAAEAQGNDTERAEFVVQGPGGDKTVFPVTVLLPSYRLSLYARVAEILPGGRADYAVAVESLNGFEGNLSFRALEKPEELDIVLPEFALQPGTGAATGIITIHAGKDALPGSYSVVIEGDGGKRFELVVVVLSEPPLPSLSSVVPRAAYVGDTVRVYGNNFGREGKLFINNRETPVSSWTGGEIVFVVPDDARSGALHILSAGAGSNALAFTVRDRGFELRPSTTILDISSGEEKTLPLAVTGYADTVALSLVCEPAAPFTAALSRTALKPKDPLDLTVKADAFAGNGSWVIVIRGKSRGFEVSVEIRVVIDDSPRIATALLPDGIVNTGYYAELAGQNARGVLVYRVARGSLPPGLSMTAQGIISGRPMEQGRYHVDIEALDSLGWKDKRSFAITIWEENWGQAGKDGGNSRSVRTDLGANKDTVWIHEGEEPVAQLLGAENRIFALGRENLFALNAENGSLVWKTRGSYKTMLYAGAKLYALADGGRLEIRDPRSGALLWTRENIEAISSDGATVLEETAARRFVRNAERGTLIEEQRKDEGDNLPLLWHYGAAYALRGSALVPLYGSGTAWDAGERILAAAADIRGGAAITEQSLILFDRNMTETRRIAAAHSPGAMLSLTDEGVSVLDNGHLRSYDREGLGFQWARGTSDGAVLANGLEKTVVVDGDGLTVLNRYDGNVIWRDEKPYAGLALYRGKIIASDTGGAIAAFSGPPNIAGPLTELRIDPPAPDESLWYTRRPRVAITSVDRETYVAQTLMRHNSGPWTDAPASFTPEEGEHDIAVYGVDSRGVAGAEARLRFRVDTGLPESDLAIHPAESESGWYNGPVTLAIDAWDEVSGIDWISTSSAAYTEPAVISGQGTHRFSWQAVDRAGNREPLREIEIRIDLAPPQAEASVEYDHGLAELIIDASDSLSGTAFIEYRINDGFVERYGEPLLFAGPGAWRIRYRAFDRAGNSGDWQNCDVFIPPDNAGAVIIDTPLLNGVPRTVAGRARNGMLLVDKGRGEDFSPGDPEAMANLPSYTLGAEYIRWAQDDALLDENASIRFRVKRNAVIYLFLPRSVPAPRGWSLVEDRAVINRLYYPGGAAVYMKRYGAGALAELPGTPAGTALPLIMAQEKGDLSADILIRRESGAEALTLEALVHPRMHSRRLPLQRRWFVNAGDGWEPLGGNRYEAGAPAETSAGIPEGTPEGEESIAAPLRFRLELCAPDGEVEHRVEKVYEEF
ncbi:MAG: PQQ-binding-like beta-propeller repeat protein [Treponema sp.]|nr:PQQ-binding-like beta-propeller repeat protein [Treponema sp.]